MSLFKKLFKKTTDSSDDYEESNGESYEYDEQCDEPYDIYAAAWTWAEDGCDPDGFWVYSR